MSVATMSSQPAFAPSPTSAASQSPGATTSTDGTGGGHSPGQETGYPLAPVESRDSVMSTVSGISAITDTQSNFPPPKTDKPRPHVCTTCGRSFARLEHLKRHERSHTKEKPFECPECTRCFARRDLLLRHQQKLHMTTTPSSRSRSGRRESTSSLGPSGTAKIRKGSVANVPAFNAHVTNPNMRPRANTISHVDVSELGFMSSPTHQSPPIPGHGHQHQLSGTGMFDFSRVTASSGPHGVPASLPRLATGHFSHEMPSGLRTAPAVTHFDMDQAFGTAAAQYSPVFSSNGSTIDPAQLSVGDAAGHRYTQISSDAIMDDGSTLDWARGFPMSLNSPSGHMADGSSPPLLSPGSTIPEHQHFDFSGKLFPQGHAPTWPQSAMMGPQSPHSAGFSVDGLNDMQNFGYLPSEFTPDHHMGMDNSAEGLYPTPPPHASSVSPAAAMSHLPGQYISQHPPSVSDGTASMSSSSITGSAGQSSVTSVATESISEATRQALLASLSQPFSLGMGSRKYSQPIVSSPLSPRDASRASPIGMNLPSTADLQRYVSAYIQYFHPHFPFLHIPTLCFDSPAYTTNLGAAGGPQTFHNGGTVGGGGCLILAMAAIGALYEYERPASKELFEAAKKMIQLYLSERRKAESQSSNARSNGDLAAQNTPVWLVQAMLLNVIYGHNCGDKTTGDIASTHCTALVSLARAAELTRPLRDVRGEPQQVKPFPPGMDVQMSDNFDYHSPWSTGILSADEDAQWRRWAAIEERKRTLFAIFHMSSLLVSGYNHAPALTNSEIQLDLPCDEDLWHAETAQVWSTKGGARAAEARAMPFSKALSTLLTASQSQKDQSASQQNQSFGGPPTSQEPPSTSDLKPSTFGCLVLINALHNYIWETRQRHSGRRWTTQETEAMHAHIEPALRAWQAAWASNPAHSLERPNPFGLGPLSADSIPLLDLAYVRLFVNLGSSKEAFWQRDFDRMSEELAKGNEIIQHAEHSELPTGQNSTTHSRNSPEPSANSAGGFKIPRTPDTMDQMHMQQPSSKRERHLRKAAFYAADSLSMSEKLGVTFADFTSRELPVQSALCAFDCAQVLAEWVATVQERVGPYLGVLGKDTVDFTQVPAILMLEDEDVKLLDKINDILKKAEAKTASDINDMGQSMAPTTVNRLPSINGNGYSSKILLVTAYMLDRAAVWPVTSLMCKGLTIQAGHMSKRADSSISVH